MNILMVGSHFSDSFHNTNAWQELASQLTSRSHAVLTTSGKSNKLLRLADMLHTIWAKRDQYQVAQVDVFSGQAFTWAFLSSKLLDALHRPFILTLRGGNLPAFSKKHPTAVSWILSKASAVTAPSAYLADQMRKFREDIVIIPNGITLDRYPFIARSAPRPNLVWLRAFHEIYNPRMAIEVLTKLMQDYPDAKLTMIGPDKGDGSLQNIQKLANELGVQNNLTFLGLVTKSEVPIYLNKGDIFLNTTYYDNTPISVMEAMACGLCIVSTNVGGIQYLIENDKESLLVPSGNVNNMTTAIKRVLLNTALGEKLSRNARRKAEGFDWSNILPIWENLINNY